MFAIKSVNNIHNISEYDDLWVTIEAKFFNIGLNIKIESILVRNVSITRGIDFYDVFILLTIRKDDVRIDDLRYIILQKAEERKSTVFIKNRTKYLNDIKNSEALLKI